MSYQRSQVKAPKLSGVALRLLTVLMENRVSRSILLPALTANVGLKAFRRHRPDGAAVNLPLVRADQAKIGQDVCGIKLADDLASREPESAEASSCLFRFFSVTDYARAYRDGEITPLEVAGQLIKALKTSGKENPSLGGVVKYEVDEIEKQAGESERRIAEGCPRSILEGVPVAIKDELDMVPFTTGVGTSFLGTQAAVFDATAVKRLRDAGAILVGKTNMFEIGISPTGDNPVHGFARTPYHQDHDAGGSSGGSAVAVASGLVPLALGADGGGSIRIPASHCGITGLKPTFGRVSESGAAPLCWSVAHVGPMGASALDTAIGYAICAGRDPGDPMTMGQPPLHLEGFHDEDLKGVTLGVDRAWFEDADAEVVACCEETLRRLEKRGGVIREVSVAGLEETRMAHAVTILTEMASAMEPHYKAHRKDFCQATRINLALARSFSGRDYVMAQRVRSDAMAEWKRIFREVDVVMTPTAATPPPFLDPPTIRYGSSDLETVTALMRFVVCANLCGMPAISFPAGYTKSVLPVGLQAIGRHWEEHLLLRVARVAEEGFERRKPRAFLGLPVIS